MAHLGHVVAYVGDVVAHWEMHSEAQLGDVVAHLGDVMVHWEMV